MFQRAGNLLSGLGGDAGIAHRGVQVLVPKQDPDHADIDLVFENMGGEAVPERVHRHPLVDLGRLYRGTTGAAELACGEKLYGIAARKQPAAGPPQPRFYRYTKDQGGRTGALPRQ